MKMVANFSKMNGRLKQFDKGAKHSLTYLLLTFIFLFVNIASSQNLQNNLEASTESHVHTYTKLFEGGSTDCHSYRIPSIVTTTKGTLIAFAECRRKSKSDRGDIDLVCKRSTNNGTTWSATKVIIYIGPDTWGNPTAVTDFTTGRIWLFLNWDKGGQKPLPIIDKWGDRKVFISHSDDDGLTWSKPEDMTGTLVPSNYKWDAIGPGVGIQTVNSNDGQLIIPATGRNIFSDDHGASWQYQIIPSGTGEGTIVELANGKLMRNDRPVRKQWELIKKRRISRGSIENGFSPFIPDKALDDPKCEGSIFRYNWDSPDRILFLNSDSQTTRCQMRVRISYDQGQTWPVSRKIYDWLSDEEAKAQGKGGYSSMTKTTDNCVGALIETCNDKGNHSIEFHKFNISWILNGTMEP